LANAPEGHAAVLGHAIVERGPWVEAYVSFQHQRDREGKDEEAYLQSRKAHEKLKDG
jgi:hypothetical protein